MADLGNQKFVVDILTKYRDEGIKQAQEAQIKLKEILGASAAAFDKTKVASQGYTANLEQFTKLSWLGVAAGETVSRVFTGIAGWAEKAAVKVAIFGEELYYMNRRLGQPGTGGLFNFAFAAQQIGLSPEQGLGAIEGMGAAIRTNPGLAGLLSKLLPGYKPGAAVGAQDTLGLVNSLKGRFGENGYFVAAQFAEQFGLGEHEFRQMWTNLEELNEQTKVASERQKQFGLDTAKSSLSFVEFHRALNTVIDILDIQATKIGAWILDREVTPILKDIGAVMQGQRPSVADHKSHKNGETGWQWLKRSIFGGSETLVEPSAIWAGIGVDRSRLQQELVANPNLRQKIMAISAGENLTPTANQAVLESMMNRALMMGTTLAFEARTTGEGGYYAGYNPAALQNPKTAAMIEENLRRVLSGSNVSNYATDNASGAFAAGRTGMYAPVLSAGGETFFYPNRMDARGADKYQTWKAAQMHSAPSGGATQNFDVDHTTHITVNGNADMGVMKDAASILGKDRWDDQLRQAVRGSNFR